MYMAQILLHPFNEMVLECTFDDLMQKIGCNQFVDISTREIVREWHKFPNNTILIPEFVEIEMFYQRFSMFTAAMKCIIVI